MLNGQLGKAKYLIRTSVLTACVYSLFSFSLHAQITVKIVDSNGQAVENAVISSSAPAQLSNPAPSEQTAVMDQVGMQFLPHVLVVAQGKAVSFPNSDDIRHHVYSFSTAKAFEIKLYKGMHGEKVIMDKPGIVELGCNIHDSMLGFIYVDATGSAVKTDAKGEAQLQISLPNEIEVWHPRLSIGKAKKVPFSLIHSESDLIELVLDIQAAPSQEKKNTFKRGFSRKFSSEDGN